MLIVLEGCDGTGKSTIAKFLSLVLPESQIVHCTVHTPNDFNFFSNLISIGRHQNIILDRGMYGQFVYQKKEERKLSNKQLTQLEMHMLQTNASVIHVTAKEDTIVQRLYDRSEVTAIPVRTIMERFDEVFSKSILPVVKLDTTNGLGLEEGL